MERAGSLTDSIASSEGSSSLDSESSQQELNRMLQRQFSVSSKWQDLLNAAAAHMPRKGKDGSFRGRVLVDFLYNFNVENGSTDMSHEKVSRLDYTWLNISIAIARFNVLWTILLNLTE